MKKTPFLILGIVFVIAISAAVMLNRGRFDETASAGRLLKVGIAPYQDMALLMNENQENLEKKYNLDVQYTTLQWNNLVPAVSSASDSIDITFESLTEFITSERNINKNTSDPLVFIYPAYVFLGGSFVSFNPRMPVITRADLNNPEKLKLFLNHSFADEAKSQYDQMLFMVAQKAGVDFNTVDIVHMDASNGLLAAENRSVDATEAGLTQRNEALTHGGKVVLDSDDLGSVDIAGFVVKQSVLNAKRGEIEDFIRLWYDSTNYVMTDINNRAVGPIKYLNSQSSTQYTADSFKSALAQEVFPNNIDEVNQLILNDGSRFNLTRIENSLIAFDLQNNIIAEPPQNISIINIATSTSQYLLIPRK